MDISKCSSEQDLVTFVEWTDKTPDIFIDFHDNPNKPNRLNCYDGESLEKWINMKDNIFAKWIQRSEHPLDSTGHYGMPDQSNKYIKLYTGEFIEIDNMVKKLQKGVKYPCIIDAYYTEIVRIGNLQGTFGISQLHGQEPGYRVYRLKEKELELRQTAHVTNPLDKYEFQETDPATLKSLDGKITIKTAPTLQIKFNDTFDIKVRETFRGDVIFFEDSDNLYKLPLNLYYDAESLPQYTKNILDKLREYDLSYLLDMSKEDLANYLREIVKEITDRFE
jgi:hypothetical protein